MKTIKVTHTLYGYKGYIGADRAQEFGTASEEFDAKEWLSTMLATGQYKLSDKSYIKMADIEAHRERMAAPVRRHAQVKFTTTLLTVTERTQAVIDGFRGLPGECEMLKCLLCVGFTLQQAAIKHTKVYSQQIQEGELIDQHFDRTLIAARMDEIYREAKAK